MKCTKNYNVRAQCLFSSLNLIMFSDVLVAFAFMVFLNSLKARLHRRFLFRQIDKIVATSKSQV